LSEPREHLADAAVVLPEFVRIVAGNVGQFRAAAGRRSEESDRDSSGDGWAYQRVPARAAV
jgi:hypothetical protein